MLLMRICVWLFGVYLFFGGRKDQVKLIIVVGRAVEI